MKRIALAAFYLAFALLVGCDASGPSSSDSSGTTEHDHDHDHGHDHGHDHAHGGPHGGHLIGLGDEAYHAEWVHDDESGRVTVYILDAEAKEDVPIPAESIEITANITDKPEQVYTLQAVQPSGDPPQSAQFEIVDEALLTTLLVAGEGAEATIRVPIGEQTYEGQFEHDEHDHGHDHAH